MIFRDEARVSKRAGLSSVMPLMRTLVRVRVTTSIWSRQLAGRSAADSAFVAAFIRASPWFSGVIFRCHTHMTPPQQSICEAKSKLHSLDIMPNMQRAKALWTVWFSQGMPASSK